MRTQATKVENDFKTIADSSEPQNIARSESRFQDHKSLDLLGRHPIENSSKEITLEKIIQTLAITDKVKMMYR